MTLIEQMEEIANSPGIFPEVEELVRMAIEAQQTGKLPGAYAYPDWVGETLIEESSL